MGSASHGCAPARTRVRPEYARAVLAAAHPASPEEEVERLVSAGMDRQAILDQAGPPLLWMILDEGVLTRLARSLSVLKTSPGSRRCTTY